MDKPTRLLDLLPPESRHEYLMGGGDFMKFTVGCVIQAVVSESYPDGPVDQAIAAIVTCARKRVAKIDEEIAKLEAEREEWRARAAQYGAMAAESTPRGVTTQPKENHPR